MAARREGSADTYRSSRALPIRLPGRRRRLIASRPGLRALLISGYAEVAVPFEDGGSSVSFLSKPFRASVLGNKVREVLSGCGSDRRKGMSRG